MLNQMEFEARAVSFLPYLPKEAPSNSSLLFGGFCLRSAPQFQQLGTKTDVPLVEWLNQFAPPLYIC